MLNKMRLKYATSRLFEEKLYEISLREVESGQRRQGLWSKAIAESDGDMQKAEGIYLRLRVQSLQDEILISSTMEAWLDQNRRPLEIEADGTTPKNNLVVSICCENCGASESLPSNDVRDLERYRTFTAEKKLFYNVLKLKCRSCGKSKEIDYLGRSWSFWGLSVTR